MTEGPRIRKGVRVVTLPDGGVISLADLPSGKDVRWVKSRKRVVALAIAHGLITMEEAIGRYSLTEEELRSWKG